MNRMNRMNRKKSGEIKENLHRLHPVFPLFPLYRTNHHIPADKGIPVILLSPQVGLAIADPSELGEAAVAADGFGSPASIGEVLFTDYVLPFQMVGILLLVAMVGAVVLTHNAQGRGASENTTTPEA